MDGILPIMEIIGDIMTHTILITTHLIMGDITTITIKGIITHGEILTIQIQQIMFSDIEVLSQEKIDMLTLNLISGTI